MIKMALEIYSSSAFHPCGDFKRAFNRKWEKKSREIKKFPSVDEKKKVKFVEIISIFTRKTKNQQQKT